MPDVSAYRPDYMFETVAGVLGGRPSLKARSGVTGGRAQVSKDDKQMTCMADLH